MGISNIKVPGGRVNFTGGDSTTYALGPRNYDLGFIHARDHAQKHIGDSAAY